MIPQPMNPTAGDSRREQPPKGTSAAATNTMADGARFDRLRSDSTNRCQARGREDPADEQRQPIEKQTGNQACFRRAPVRPRRNTRRSASDGPTAPARSAHREITVATEPTVPTNRVLGGTMIPR